MRSLFIALALLLGPLASRAQAADWLQDVQWIITDLERAEYKQARKRGEQEAFIEAFWQRRDPTPATPANEFKKDWERRLTQVKKRFREDRPAVETDRGRVYLLNGAPHQIKTQGGYEVWLYLGDASRELLEKDFAVVFQEPRARFFSQLNAARAMSSPVSSIDSSAGEARARQYQSGITSDTSDSRYELVLAGPQVDILEADGSLRATVVFENGHPRDYMKAVLTPR